MFNRKAVLRMTRADVSQMLRFVAHQVAGESSEAGAAPPYPAVLSEGCPERWEGALGRPWWRTSLAPELRVKRKVAVTSHSADRVVSGSFRPQRPPRSMRLGQSCRLGKRSHKLHAKSSLWSCWLIVKARQPAWEKG